MATANNRRNITISGNWEINGPDNLWAGRGTVDQCGNIECSANLYGDAYEQIEEQVSDGDSEGTVIASADDGREVTYNWRIEV